MIFELFQTFQYLPVSGGYPQYFGSFLQQLESLGFFDYVLPFLLIFALVYGILDKSGFLGDNRGVNVVIAVAVGFLSLAFGDVSAFFSLIFPKAGIGLSVLLVALILMGLFVPLGDDDTTRWGGYVFFGLGVLLFLYIFFSSVNEFAFWRGDWLTTYWPGILILIVSVGIIALVVFGGKRNRTH